MDEIDAKLLQILSENADATATDMMAQVNLSIPAINKRILKLKQRGIIRQFTVVTDPEKVGKPVMAFILVVLQQYAGVGAFMEHIRRDPDILECCAVTGEYDYLLKVCARDIRTLEEKLLGLKQLRGVAKSHTMMALQEHKHRVTVLPQREKEDT